jgi:hypothetical protein
MLDVADVAHAAPGMIETISRRPLRVRQRVSAHRHAIGKGQRLTGAKAVVLEPRGEFSEADREERWAVKPFQRFLCARPAEIAAPDVDGVPTLQGGLEEGQAPYVVEVEMAEEEIDVLRGSAVQLDAEGCETRSSVDDEEPLPASDLDARGLAAELDVFWP